VFGHEDFTELSMCVPTPGDDCLFDMSKHNIVVVCVSTDNVYSQRGHYHHHRNHVLIIHLDKCFVLTNTRTTHTKSKPKNPTNLPLFDWIYSYMLRLLERKRRPQDLQVHTKWRTLRVKMIVNRRRRPAKGAGSGRLRSRTIREELRVRP
jgi:hypothetical protein